MKNRQPGQEPQGCEYNVFVSLKDEISSRWVWLFSLRNCTNTYRNPMANIQLTLRKHKLLKKYIANNRKIIARDGTFHPTNKKKTGFSSYKNPHFIYSSLTHSRHPRYILIFVKGPKWFSQVRKQPRSRSYFGLRPFVPHAHFESVFISSLRARRL